MGHLPRGGVGVAPTWRCGGGCVTYLEVGWWVWGGVAVIGVIQKLNEKYFIKFFKMRESWRETL